MEVPQVFLDNGTIVAIDEGFVAGDENAVPNCSMVTQELTKWCWAAVTQTIEGVRGNNVEQCAVAESILGPGCCADKLSCHDEEALPDVLAARQVPCTPQGGKVGFPAIKDEIDAGRPVACFIRFPTINHLILISGYFPGEQLQLLDPGYDDPMPPREQSYASFKLLYRDDGSWLNTYFLV